MLIKRCKKWIVFFIFFSLINILCVNSVFISLNSPKFEPVLFRKPFECKINTEDENYIEISGIIRNSYISYINVCSDYDNIKDDESCEKSNGFFSSLFESLESLYLFGHNDLLLESKIRISKINIREIEWVSKREFWGRCIGSLIGIYHLSNDHFYLEIAERFACICMDIDQAPIPLCSIINFNKSLCKSVQWNHGVHISDILAGLPELLSLYYITNSANYLYYAHSIINEVIKKGIPAYYSKSNTNLSRDWSYSPSFSFINQLYTIFKLYPVFNISKIINRITKIALSSYDCSDLTPLIELTLELGIRLDSNSKIKKCSIANNAITSYLKLDNFLFESDLLRLFYTNKIEFDRDQVLEDAVEIIEYCLSGSIINGFSNTKQGVVFDGIQHSSFFSWANIVLLLSTAIETKTKIMFNQYGHVLHIE